MEKEIAIYVKLEFHMILLIYKNCVQYSIASTIYNCPSDIKCKLYTHSLSGLIWYCKRYFIDSYAIECNIPGCYVCLNNWYLYMYVYAYKQNHIFYYEKMFHCDDYFFF